MEMISHFEMCKAMKSYDVKASMIVSIRHYF